MMEKRSKEADSIDDILEALKMFYKDNVGKITVREMRYALGNTGNMMSTEEVDEFVSGAASNYSQRCSQANESEMSLSYDKPFLLISIVYH